MKLRRARLRAFAKINLDLRILHKRADGFHELRTVFQTVSLADRIDIEFEPARRTSITLDDPQAIPDNLLIRAAHAVLDATKTKRLRPYAAEQANPDGWRARRRLVRRGSRSLSSTRSRAKPAKARKSARASPGSRQRRSLLPRRRRRRRSRPRRGTIPSPRPFPQPILIISTGLHVSTAPAYQALGRGLTFPDSASRIKGFQAFVRALSDGPAEAVGKFSANDFEAVVFRQHPQLKNIREKLSKLGAKGVRMTGSGSAIFAIFDTAEKRAAALAGLKRDKTMSSLLVVPAFTVSRAGYRRVWRNQLREYLEPNSSLWPPQSRYAR